MAFFRVSNVISSASCDCRQRERQRRIKDFPQNMTTTSWSISSQRLDHCDLWAANLSALTLSGRLLDMMSTWREIVSTRLLLLVRRSSSAGRETVQPGVLYPDACWVNNECTQARLYIGRQKCFVNVCYCCFLQRTYHLSDLCAAFKSSRVYLHVTTDKLFFKAHEKYLFRLLIFGSYVTLTSSQHKRFSQKKKETNMYLLSCCWKHELLSTSFFFGPKQYFMQT